MQGMDKAASLMLEACTSFREAADGLVGQLEIDVERAASKCWDIREKSVQIKGRFMRSKTLIVEDPIFVPDAEDAFGEALSRWEDVGAGGVAAAAVEARAAEDRLVHVVALVLEQDPEAQLHALDVLLSLNDSISRIALPEMLPESIKLIRDLALQLGHCYLSSTASGTAAVPSLAAVLAKHGGSSEWAASLLQPEPQDVLPVLRAIGGGGAAPSALMHLLRQCNLATTPEKDLPALPQALADVLPVGSSDDRGTAEISIVLQNAILSIGQDYLSGSAVAACAAAEASLLLLLAAAKGISPVTLRKDLKIDNVEGASLTSVTISDLATWVFSSRPDQVNHVIVSQLLVACPWDWLSQACPPALRLRWLLGVVAAVKALAQFGGPEDSGVMRAVVDALSAAPGWVLAQGDAERAADEAHMLCMLEVPQSEPAAVHLQWRQIQVSVALALCCHWLNVEAPDARENISSLLEAARVGDALAQMVQNGRSVAAASVMGRAVNAASWAPEFRAMLSTLGVVLGAALGAEGDEGQNATSAVAAAVAEAVVRCNQEGGRGDLIKGMQLIRLESGEDLGAQTGQSGTDSTGSTVQVKERKKDPYCAVVTWLGLLVGEVAQGAGALPPQAIALTADLTRAAYCLIGSVISSPTEGETGDLKSEKTAELRLAQLALSLANALRGLPAQRSEQLLSQLFTSDKPWLRVIGAWVSDSISLGSIMPINSGEGWTLAEAEAALAAAGAAGGVDADAAANEFFLLQEAVSGVAGTAPVAGAVLWFELFLRIKKHWANLQPVVDPQEITINISSVSHALYANSPTLANELTALVKMTQDPSAVPTILPFIGSFVAAREAAVIDSSWQDQWKLPPSPAPSGGGLTFQLPPPVPLPNPGDISFLATRQQAQETALRNAGDELRYWARRGEKAAARVEGEEPSPEDGRDGDVPESLSEAQRLLWEGSQRWNEELSQVHAALRQRVCQQYNPLDEQFLQDTAEAFQDGQRIPHSMIYRDSQHSTKCRELRERARAIALGTLHAKEVSLAAEELFKFEYLLLETTAKGEEPQERAHVRSMLLSAMGQSLLDGSSPPPAAPFLVGLFERAVGSGGVILDTDAKLRLIPRIAEALGGPAGVPQRLRGAPSPVRLREEEGVRLLKACLDPDALLNAGRLREFMSALQLVERLCRGVGGDQASAMLASFDAQRFAVLVSEKPEAVHAGAGGSSSSSGKLGDVSMEEVLSMAAKCLAYPGSAATGGALVEGVLGMTPATLYAACLGVVVNSPSSGRRDALLSMLSRVPMEMLTSSILAEALTLVTEALSAGKADPPDLPYDLLGALLHSTPVLQSLRESVDAAGKEEKKGGRMESSSEMKESAWTVHVSGTNTLPRGTVSNFENGGGSSSGPGASSGTSSSSAQSTPLVSGIGGSGASDTGHLTPPSISLQPISTTHLPLGQLADEALGAAMDAVLRVLRRGVLDEASAGDHVQQVLGLVMGVAGQHAQQDAWGLEWAWELYQRRLSTFVQESSGATGGTAAFSFQQYWCSLPWEEATFHLKSPKQVAAIRDFLANEDMAAAELTHRLNWDVVLSAAAPRQQIQPTVAAGGGTGVFTLIDEEEEEALIHSTTTGAAGTADGVGSGTRGQWAAEVGLLLIHCTVFLAQSARDIPEWVRAHILDGSGPESVVEASRILAGADWHKIEEIVLSPALPAPWLVLPVLMAPKSVRGDVGQRLVHAAVMLRDGAKIQGSPAAGAVVAQAVRPLLALSICQGVQLEVGAGRGAIAGVPGQSPIASAALAATIASHQLIDIPEDIPEELLQDTVEFQQLRLQKEQLQLAEDEAVAAAAAAAVAAADEQQATGANVPLIEVSACFRLTAAHHVALIKDVLGPLAAMHAPANIATITKEHCVDKLEPPSSTQNQQTEDTGVKFWEGLSGSELAVLESSAGSANLVGNPDRAALAASMCISLLQPLVQRPVTIITQAHLPFSNAELPWFIENTSSVVFIVSGQGGVAQSPQRRPGRSMRALRQQIASLLRRKDTDDVDGSVDPETALNRAVTDAVALRNLMAHLIQDTGVRENYSREKLLGACLLRCVILTPSVHNSATVTHFAEDLVRALASNGVAGEGAAATAAGGYLNGAGVGQETHHAAEEVPVVVAGGEETSTVTRVEGQPPGQIPGSNLSQGIGLGLDFPPGEPDIAVPPSMHLAAAAASELPPKDLLRLANGAVRMRRPLLAAFALSAARRAAVAVDKLTWQVHVTEALKVATGSEHNAEHPQEMIAPWMDILRWLADSRWRRLPPGSHTAALSEFLDGLSRRTQVIGVLTPEELVDPNSRERRNPLSAVASAAAGKLRQIGQSSGGHGEASLVGDSTGRSEATSSSSGGNATYHASPTAQQQQQQPQPQPNYSHQPSPRGIPASISEIEYPLPPPEEDPTLGKKLASGFRTLGKSVTQAGKSVSQAGSKLIHKRPSHMGSASSPSGVSSSSASAAYEGASGSSPRPSPSSRQLEAIEPERDQLVREGLAAFAVASYIRSVMDPRLTRRTASGAEPLAPGSLSGRVQPTHTRGDSRLTGSRQQEELEFSDFDTLLASREAVDYLGQLAEKPLLKSHRALYAPFLDRMPQLLTSTTGIGTFVVEVTRLLLPGSNADVVLAVLLHTAY